MLLTFWRSQAPFRVRIALNLKGPTREATVISLESRRPVQAGAQSAESVTGGADLV
jgi:hypothetical protein